MSASFCVKNPYAASLTFSKLGLFFNKKKSDKSLIVFSGTFCGPSFLPNISVSLGIENFPS